jgi:hypothetical protein
MARYKCGFNFLVGDTNDVCTFVYVTFRLHRRATDYNYSTTNPYHSPRDVVPEVELFDVRAVRDEAFELDALHHLVIVEYHQL